MKRVAIVDYGMGNLDSVRRAIEECGGEPFITDQAQELESANYIILPGVGAFSVGMQNIQQRNLDTLLKEQVCNRSNLETANTFWQSKIYPLRRPERLRSRRQ